MSLIRFKWNGGLELGPKETIAAVMFLVSAGGALAGYRDMKALVSEQITVQKLQASTLQMHDSRLHYMEERVSSCCPYYVPPKFDLTPKDLVPPAMKEPKP